MPCVKSLVTRDAAGGLGPGPVDLLSRRRLLAWLASLLVLLSLHGGHPHGVVGLVATVGSIRILAAGCRLSALLLLLLSCGGLAVASTRCTVALLWL